MLGGLVADQRHRAGHRAQARQQRGRAARRARSGSGGTTRGGRRRSTCPRARGARWAGGCARRRPRRGGPRCPCGRAAARASRAGARRRRRAGRRRGRRPARARGPRWRRRRGLRLAAAEQLEAELARRGGEMTGQLGGAVIVDDEDVGVLDRGPGGDKAAQQTVELLGAAQAHGNDDHGRDGGLHEPFFGSRRAGLERVLLAPAHDAVAHLVEAERQGVARAPGALELRALPGVARPREHAAAELQLTRLPRPQRGRHVTARRADGAPGELRYS